MKKVVYAEERMHIGRRLALVGIAGVFIFSAGLAGISMLKTTNIIQHADIYRKHHSYDCSVEDGDSEAFNTGSKQLISFSDQMLDSALKTNSSKELNINPKFELDNKNEPELPLGYRSTSVGEAKGVFLHNKQANTLNTFVTITEGTGGLAGWYMDYFPVQSTRAYVYSVSYWLDGAEAKVIHEEVNKDGVRKYGDADLLKPTDGRTTKRYVFLPSDDTAKMRFYVQMTSQGSMTTYEESIKDLKNTGLDQPLVSITFDDGWSSIYHKGKPIFEDLNIVTTQFIIAESFRSLLAGYMDLAQVKKLSEEGHEIASHSLRHCNLVRLSNENVAYDLINSKRTLETEFPEVKGLAYPFGSFNQETKTLASKDYRYLRTATSGFTNILMDKMEMRSITIDPSLTLEQYKALVDEAAVKHYWLILVYHKIEDNPGIYGITPTVLREQLSYLKASKANIVTVANGVSIVEHQQKERFGVVIDQKE